jgi:hypothetical protein
VLPVLEGKPLQQITPVMLNTLYANLASPTSDRNELSAKTISYSHTIVHKALSDAVDALSPEAAVRSRQSARDDTRLLSAADS